MQAVLWRRADYTKDMGNCVMYILRPGYTRDRELWFYVNGDVISMKARINWDRKPTWERL